jgi:hypothetical protein
LTTLGFTYSGLVLSINNNQYNQAIITGNWIDMKSAGTGKSIFGRAGTPVGSPNCAIPASFLNNFDPSGLYDSTHMNEWIDGLTGTNC